MKHASPLTLAALAVAGLASAPAMALEVYNNKGWSLDISGSVNAFYTTSKTISQCYISSIYLTCKIFYFFFIHAFE